MKTSLDSVRKDSAEDVSLVFFVPHLSLVGGSSLVPVAHAKGDVVV